MNFEIRPQCFIEKVKEFDQFMIDQAMIPNNYTKWSDKQHYDREVMERRYVHMLKCLYRDGEPLQDHSFIRVRLPKTANRIMFDIYTNGINLT